MNKCVFCTCSENLNTSMTVTLDDNSKVTVMVCDDHAEDATVKTVREAYLAKKVEIDKILEMAKAYGLNISESNNLTIVSKPTKQDDIRQPQRQPEPEVTIDDDMVSSEIYDNAKNNIKINASGDAAAYRGANGGLSKSQLTDKIDTSGKVKLVNVEGRSGMNIVIPTKRVDSTGTTRISISKRENDTTLQNRFKNMADKSKNDQMPDFRNGYDDSLRKCPMCDGSCFVVSKGIESVCAKCHGSGSIVIG